MTSPVKFARQLRQKQTKEEIIFWDEVRNRRFRGLKFRRQVPVDNYVVDFLCESERLIVEIDGADHLDRVDYDIARTDTLIAHGYRVIRFTNEDVSDDVSGVLDQILRFIGSE